MSEPATGGSPRARGVRFIVVYKSTKAAVQALLAAAVMALFATGSIERTRLLAATLRQHVVHHWSIRLAELVLKTLTGKRLYWLVAALIGDAIISGVEGWALARGHQWGMWLVVAATGLLLPVEIVEMVHRLSLGRVAIFGANLWISSYLLRQALREHRAAHPHRSPPPPPQ
jgi:uncharacterized membrane protein (DUF2068 family)